MTERITFWRWMAKPRQLASFAGMAVVALGAAYVMREYVPDTPETQLAFFTGGMAAFFVAFLVFTIPRDPGDYE